MQNLVRCLYLRRAAHRTNKAEIERATETGIHLQHFSSRARVRSSIPPCPGQCHFRTDVTELFAHMLLKYILTSLHVLGLRICHVCWRTSAKAVLYTEERTLQKSKRQRRLFSLLLPPPLPSPVNKPQRTQQSRQVPINVFANLGLPSACD